MLAACTRSVGTEPSATASVSREVDATRSQGTAATTSTLPTPRAGQDIFAGVRGWLAYGDSGGPRYLTDRGSWEAHGEGIWAVNPEQPGPREDRIRLSDQLSQPVAWSADGSSLLIARAWLPDGTVVRHPSMTKRGIRIGLLVLHSDGTETRVVTLRADSQIFLGASLSPDASRVIYAAVGRRESSPSGIYVVDAPGGAPRLLRSATMEPVVVPGLRGEMYFPAFSPDGTKIAYFYGGGDHDHSLRIMNTDGTNVRVLFGADQRPNDAAWHVYGLAWSPDGSQLAFDADGPGVKGVWVIDADGSGLARVIPEGMRPSWSPDGSRIAYVRHRALYVADRDGTHVRRLMANMQRPWWCCGGVPWNPLPPSAPGDVPSAATGTSTAASMPAPRDVGSLAFAMDGDVYVGDWDGSNPVRIADGRPGCEYAGEGPLWSPDGRYLAYRHADCDDARNEWGVVVISDREGNVVASFPGEGWRISWSPDSSRVAVWDRFEQTIGIYGLDGERQRVLTLPPGWKQSGDVDPVWLPDGRSLFVGENAVIPVDGSTPHLTNQHLGMFPAFSPDGSRVALGRRSLAVAEPDGSHPREVFDPEEPQSFITSSLWSPTSDRIAFTLVTYANAPGDFRSESFRVGVVNVATGLVTMLAHTDGNDEYVTALDFSGDGTRILFRRDHKGARTWWSVNADGSDLRLLITRASSADWQPRRPTR